MRRQCEGLDAKSRQRLKGIQGFTVTIEMFANTIKQLTFLIQNFTLIDHSISHLMFHSSQQLTLTIQPLLYFHSLVFIL